MKMRLFVIFLLSFFFDKIIIGQSTGLHEKAITLKRVIELNHYSPRVVNDSFSIAVFNSIIKTIDSRRLFLTSAEYKQLYSYSKKLDDELTGNGWAFFDQLSTIYKRSLLRADSIVDAVGQKPFDFSTEENISFASEASFNFSTTNQELTARWIRYLKFVVLRTVYYNSVNDSVARNRQFDKLEKDTRTKIRNNEKKLIKNILSYPQGINAYLSEIYLDAIASAFDPHTNYFSQEGKEEFQSELSSEGLSFGIDLDENEKGQIIVQHLQPGGPAWKSGELHKNDVLLQIQKDDKDVMDMNGETISDVYEYIGAVGHETLLFRVQKSNGQEKTITLKKEKINNEENVVKSFVLEGNKKIGYIFLPGFYTEWENDGGSSCASDVAKEIIRLKRLNIDGLILDVRYNGGGSVGEALDMAGIFIDEGPLSAAKDRTGKLTYLKDPNRGVIYAGPMVLMVNSQSASASELLAAALQDYNRALIVGGQTYGKATMQEMFFLDTLSKKPAAGKAATEAIKITIAKLFRLNGESAQLRGVMPDIQLPDEFELMKTGERFYPNALSSDTVRKNNFYKALPPLPKSVLAEKSAARVNKNPEFQQINKSIESLQQREKQKIQTIPLKRQSFEKWFAENKMPFEEESSKTQTIFEANVLEQATITGVDNDDARDWNKALVKNIRDDIYTQEAFLILCDFISLQKPTQ